MPYPIPVALAQRAWQPFPTHHAAQARGMVRQRAGTSRSFGRYSFGAGRRGIVHANADKAGKPAGEEDPNKKDIKVGLR